MLKETYIITSVMTFSPEQDMRVHRGRRFASFDVTDVNCDIASMTH